MWADSDHDSVVKMLGLVCEITATQLSKPAATLMVKALSNYPAKQVLSALERCAAECKFRLTLADVISRLDDGRPGAEEAWGAMPKTEDEAGLVTDEMSIAWGAASKLFLEDHIGARKTFLEVYAESVRKARADSRPVVWRVSPGFDKASTESVAIEGMKRHLLPIPSALQYIAPDHHEFALHAAGLGPRALPPPKTTERIKQLVAGVTARLSEPPANPPHWTDEKDSE
jgi:hypothetical protein